MANSYKMYESHGSKDFSSRFSWRDISFLELTFDDFLNHFDGGGGVVSRDGDGVVIVDIDFAATVFLYLFQSFPVGADDV